MRRFCFIALVTALFAAVVACDPQPSPEQKTEPVYQPGDSLEVVGLLVDTNCFAGDPQNIGPDHPSPVPEGQAGPGCARFCARMGFPVAVLTGGDPGGKVWILLTNGQVLADYMSRTVRARGRVRSDGVLVPERIELRTGDGWTFIL
ncbi:hypothetical protein GQ464_006100 [Rhodocaloribacter litoris]|uniref:hypothetical protein n=1 Tax=Rhodocaloribacter litoris TaxID=2558931 RepID=UPI001E3C2F4A|nr:hypothetical protein [Rhodocaloribacter litoris]QXD16518.1 hypothetical protein GQ464_006100 [Rhodocaloribacter litoris]GIV59486.1 MAG: hypothetical protein KatS3mg043_0575 [Rhodothermaceae bacterium]